MTTETPTAEPFDAFEQRLAAALALEAGTASVPTDGRALVDARISRRRRARRATWLAAAAVLVLAAGAIGVATRTTSSDSTPYVDTDSTSELPLLGFGEEGWGLLQYAPGVSYFVTDARAAEAATPSRTLQLVNRSSDLGEGAFIWTEEESTSIDDRDIRLGTLTTDDGEGHQSSVPAAWWDAGDGWTATVHIDGGDNDRATLVATVAAVREVPMDLWEQRLYGFSGSTSPFDEPLLVLGPGAGATQLIGISGSAVTAWLTPEEEGLPQVTLGALASNVDAGELDTASKTSVRGRPGSYTPGRGGDQAKLLWTEDGQKYLMAAKAGTALEQLTRIADLLVVPTEDVWRGLVYPDGPQDFPDIRHSQVDSTIPSGP